MRRHRLKGNFGAKIRVIRDTIWRNLWTFLVSVFGFRQKVLLISVALVIILAVVYTDINNEETGDYEEPSGIRPILRGDMWRKYAS
jgi:hypothetical protein